MNLVSFIRSSLRLLRSAKKPDRGEVWLSVKICFLGVLLIGLVGFVVYVLALFISGFFSSIAGA